jgi:hypothetical protein
MKLLPRGGWLLVLAMAAVIVSASSRARTWLRVGVRDRLTQKYQQRLGGLTERQAALLVRRLARANGDWLDVLVAASADDRPAVAAAADTELRELVDRWAELPEENAPHIADLAGLLAQQAPRLPAERRQLAHSLAQRLIDWPIDGRLVDSAQLIADCESVLVLPRIDFSVARVAAASEPRSAEPVAKPPPPAAPVLPSAPAVSLSPASGSILDATPAPPQTMISRPPALFPQTSRQVPQQPRPFKAASPMKISDE